MAERAHGFSLRDHRRVSRMVRDYDQGVIERKSVVRKSDRPERGLVRVMLLNGIADGLLPDPVKGDFLLDATSFKAVITQPTSVEFDGDVHYVIRCVAADQSVTVRTWQLRVIPPERGDGTLTVPIDEHASAAEVQAAINATGCPECRVVGAGNYLVDLDGTHVDWPGRQWHVIWPDNDWYLTLTRMIDMGGTPGQEYDVGGDEVPVALIPTAYAPTPFCEDVWLPFTRSFAAPTPGTFALCQELPGLGLVLMDVECWKNVDG